MNSLPPVPAKVILREGATIADALKSLTVSGVGVALLCDRDDRLLALYTDGDLRRLLLEGRSMTASLDPTGRKSPRSASGHPTHADALSAMDVGRIDHLPVVDDAGRLTGLFRRRDIAQKIWLSSPHIGEDEMHFVNEAFATNWIAPLGPNVDAFERELGSVVGRSHAAALSSGTAAIHLALILLGIGRGDRVICPSLTFAASANPIVYQGGEPVFVDSERASWNMCPDALERALARCKQDGRPAKAVIVVDLYGQAADYDRILPICDAYGVPVIEDAAEALGANLKGRPCASFGRMGILSFNGNKIITTSGGGMLVADDEDLIRRARKLSTQAREDRPWYEHEEIGYNYRMSNVLAGIGRGQLGVLAERVAARRAVFDRYRELLADVGEIEWMPEFDGSFSNRWLTTCTLADNIDPQAVCDDMARLDIEARRVWKPMHRQPVFQGCDYFVSGNSDVAGALFDQGLCLPSGSNMTDDQVERVCEVLISAIGRARQSSRAA